MKEPIILMLLSFTVLNCNNIKTQKEDKLALIEIEEQSEKIFKEVVDFPKIKDTTFFINELKETFDLEINENPLENQPQNITTYKKVKINGSDKDFIFIEYDWNGGSTAQFPWKNQLLLTTEGKIVKVLSGLRFDFIPVFLEENPFLLIVNATGKGNGGHKLYKILADTLENVYEGYYDYALRTYDAHQDNAVYEPKELKMKVKDYDNDGYNDISFNGKIVLIQGKTKNGTWYDSEIINGKTVTYSVDNPFKKIPVEFIFIYNKENGHFVPQENYLKK